MKKLLSYTVRTFRFKRWNRAGYSAFMSFGKQISIGRLRVDVADGLLRDKHLRRLLLTDVFSAYYTLYSDSDDDSDDGGVAEQLECLLVNAVVPADESPATERTLLYVIWVNPIFFIMKLIGFFNFIRI